MKKFKKAIILLIIAVSINIGSAQTFIPEWNNNYSNWLGSWYLTNNDYYIRANLSMGLSTDKDYLELLNINISNGWAMICRKTTNGYFNSEWNNNGNNEIGNWYINSDDKYITLYDSQSKTHELLSINSRTGYAEKQKYHTGEYPYWEQTWGSSNGWISGWCTSSNDTYLSGNFDYSTDSHELMCINPESGWVAIYKSYGGSFAGTYSNGGNDHIGGWILRNDDIYISGDIDGDNHAELIIINRGTGYTGIFKIINDDLVCIWYNESVGLGGWTNFNYTKIMFHDFDNDGSQEIMFVNDPWCTIKKYNGNTYWPNYFCNNGNGYIDGWHIGSADIYTGGNFDGYSNVENLLFMNLSNGLASLCHTNIATEEDNISLKTDDAVQVYPNPFNMNTKLSITLKRDENVKIIIYDILGKEIKLINNSVLTKGTHSFIWDGKDNNNNTVSSGTYFLNTIAGISLSTKRLVINK